MTRNMYLLAISSAVLFCAFPADADETLLRWKLHPDQTLNIRIDQTIKTEATGIPKPRNLSLTLLMEVSWTVVEVSDQGVARIKHTLNRFASTRTGDLPTIQFDSADDRRLSGPARSIADSVRPLLGTEFLVTMNDRGEFIDVAMPEGQIAQSANAKFAAMLTPKGISEIMRQSAVVLPQQPLDSGGQWTSDAKLTTSLGVLQQQNTYAYAGTVLHDGRPQEKIEVVTDLELMTPANDSSSKSVLREHKCSGVLWFDAEAGRFAASEVNQSLTLERPYRQLRIRIRTDTDTKMRIEAGP